MRQRRQTHKLKVGEAGFENHVGGDVEFNRILPEREFVEEVPRRNGEPVVGVVKLMRPIKLWVPADQLMHQEQRNLGMAKLVQGAEAGHGPPGAVAAETSAAEIADGSGEFRKGQSGGVYLQAINPGRRQALYVFQPADGVAHRIDRHVLFMLVLDVFTVGCLEGFFPMLPTGVRKPGMSTDY